MREDQNRNQGGWDNRLEENQRIGKQIAQNNRNQNWSEQYRSGRDFHNEQNPGNNGHQHYGADPNSAYRNPNINYGDNREHRGNYNSGQNHQQHNQPSWPVDRGQNNQNNGSRIHDNQFHHDNRNQNNYQNYNYQGNRFNQGDFNHDNRFNQDNRYQQGRYQTNRYDNGERYDVNRYVESDNRFYAGEEPRLFDDRKQFEAEDYRYGSGKRHWESPGHDNDYDADNDRNNNHRRHNDQNDNRGFFGRIADQVRDDWRTFTHPEENPNQHRQQPNPFQNQNNENRDFDRGYESGPRWADENDFRRNNERRPNRNYDNDNRRY